MKQFPLITRYSRAITAAWMVSLGSLAGLLPAAPLPLEDVLAKAQEIDKLITAKL
jgi:hypothetical protein